ncbi:MAG: beta-glucosidase BglX, partial [Bacteroidota bacterium]
GYGLSYTTFEYTKPVISSTTMTKGKNLTVSLTVRNTGKMAGHEVVQMYIRDLVGSISRPLKELKGFQKIYLQPGESREVVFSIDEELLKFYNETLEYKAEPGEFNVMIGANSRDVQTISFVLE